MFDPLASQKRILSVLKEYLSPRLRRGTLSAISDKVMTVRVWVSDIGQPPFRFSDICIGSSSLRGAARAPRLAFADPRDPLGLYVGRVGLTPPLKKAIKEAS